MLASIGLLVHFGLFVLIWLVQVIIYPSFRHIDLNDFTQWHEKYMGLISFFVIPLMFSQVGIVGYFIFYDYSWVHLVTGILITLVWFSTFVLSVPCHNHLQQGKDIVMVEKLINTNWYRTVLWSLVFLLNFVFLTLTCYDLL